MECMVEVTIVTKEDQTIKMLMVGERNPWLKILQLHQVHSWNVKVVIVENQFSYDAAHYPYKYTNI